MTALGLLLVLLLGPGWAEAAELLQVSSATRLQVGDRNRHYPVELACLSVAADTGAEATDWLRRQLPRGTRLNLRPLESSDEILVARVSRLDNGQDLSDALIAAGLARPQPCP